jgi:hypothetical protein
MQEPNQNPAGQRPNSEKTSLLINIKQIVTNYGFTTGACNRIDAVIMHQSGAMMPIEVPREAIRPVGCYFAVDKGCDFGSGCGFGNGGGVTRFG